MKIKDLRIRKNFMALSTFKSKGQRIFFVTSKHFISYSCSQEEIGIFFFSSVVSNIHFYFLFSSFCASSDDDDEKEIAKQIAWVLQYSWERKEKKKVWIENVSVCQKEFYWHREQKAVKKVATMPDIVKSCPETSVVGGNVTKTVKRKEFNWLI